MRFVIRRNAAGKFSWRAVGDNNEIIASSEVLESKHACEGAIALIKREAAAAKVVDQTAAGSEEL
jgi:uncharacterized protein YegP (UPF0339 family)